MNGGCRARARASQRGAERMWVCACPAHQHAAGGKDLLHVRVQCERHKADAGAQKEAHDDVKHGVHAHVCRVRAPLASDAERCALRRLTEARQADKCVHDDGVVGRKLAALWAELRLQEVGEQR